MIYTKEDVKRELERYFDEDVEGNNDDIVTKIKSDIDKVCNQSDVLNACKMIKDSFVNLSDKNGVLVFKDKKFLPDWVKYLVYVVIYQYFENNYENNKEPKYMQSSLLKEMGLYADIFGKKNWCMYSPDMKIRQAEYAFHDIPFNHAEVESNEVYRAMIHYMTCYSTVLTDSFVDVFGKLGIIPIDCAPGYKFVETWLNDKEYKSFAVFLFALKKPKTIKKHLEKLQFQIRERLVAVKDKGNNEKEKTIFLRQKEIVSLFLGVLVGFECSLNELSSDEIQLLIERDVPLFLELRMAGIEKDIAQKIIENHKKNADDKWEKTDINKIFAWCKDEEKRRDLSIKFSQRPDIYKFAAYFILRCYFAPEYWKNNRLTYGYDEKGEVSIFAELNDAWIEAKIGEFLSIDAETILDTLYSFYKVKRFSVKQVNYLKSVNNMYDYYVNDTKILFLDVPKFIREEKRFGVNAEWYDELLSVLTAYQGDWILSWKTFIELSSVKEKNNEENVIYTDLYSGQKIIPSGYNDYDEELDIPKVSAEELEKNKAKIKKKILRIYDSLLEMSKERQLYVFKYRTTHSHGAPNSIVFITTIDFPKVDDEIEFERKYSLVIDRGEKIVEKYFNKERYEDFYINMMRYIKRDFNKKDDK